jgi:hypothetical protein
MNVALKLKQILYYCCIAILFLLPCAETKHVLRIESISLLEARADLFSRLDQRRHLEVIVDLFHR